MEAMGCAQRWAGKMISRHLLAAGIGIGGLFLLSAVLRQPIESWLIVKDYNKLIVDLLVDEAKAKWHANPHQDMNVAGSYQTDGPYLHYARGGICGPIKDSRVVDDNGVVLTLIAGKPYYHPVMLAQCGLYSLSGFYTGRQKDYENGLHYARQLAKMTDSSGGIPYPFSYTVGSTGDRLQPGWTSGMAQGQALSLFARAIIQTHDHDLISAGRQALNHMTAWEKDGGNQISLGQIKSAWASNIFFEEYPTSPPSYTLNGFMFSLLGVYDWSNVPDLPETERQNARDVFYQGIATLKLILPLYTFNGFVTYDLTHITIPTKKPYFNPSYQEVHVALLSVLNSIAPDEEFAQFIAEWKTAIAPS